MVLIDYNSVDLMEYGTDDRCNFLLNESADRPAMKPGFIYGLKYTLIKTSHINVSHINLRTTLSPEDGGISLTTECLHVPVMNADH